jgi:hypothetical protein
MRAKGQAARDSGQPRHVPRWVPNAALSSTTKRWLLGMGVARTRCSGAVWWHVGGLPAAFRELLIAAAEASEAGP